MPPESITSITQARRQSRSKREGSRGARHTFGRWCAPDRTSDWIRIRLVHPAMTADLLLNAIVAGLLLGGFYAAVTVGISISFGMLDVVNIAHPAFIIVGSYIA